MAKTKFSIPAYKAIENDFIFIKTTDGKKKRLFIIGIRAIDEVFLRFTTVAGNSFLLRRDDMVTVSE